MPRIAEWKGAKAPAWLSDRRVLAGLGVSIWLAPFLAISVLIALNPEYRSVTPTYHEACANWWAGKHLYGGLGGLHYLPQFVLIFAPFHWLPVPVGDILWCLCGTGLLATGVLRFVREQFGADNARAFSTLRF